MPSDNRTVPAVVVHDPARRPNLTGDLDAILVNIPAFRSRLRGYDRLQVDNYVRWAETEMLSTRREVDDLAARYGLCLAEVKDLRQRVAESPEGRQLQQVSERIGQMLRLAADEAAALRAGATDEAATLRADATEEAERVLDEARTEAEATLQRAREREEAAVAKADKLHTDAREELAQADAVLVRARAEATRLSEEAAAERSRLAERAAAERAAQVAAMNSELADLGKQRDQARQCLSRLGAQIAQALDALAEGLPRDVRVPQNGERQHVLAGNRVAAP